MAKYILTQTKRGTVAKRLKKPVKIVTAENIVEAHRKSIGGWIYPTTKRQWAAQQLKGFHLKLRRK